jgi:histidine triad (HIT) family protein
MAEPTIFERIIRREIPAEIVHEDAHCLAFRDVHPQAPTHVLLIPKRSIRSLAQLTTEDQELMGHLLLTATRIAQDLGLTQGYRLVCNCGADGGQSVDHLHFHILGGRHMHWPPG